VLEKYKDKDMFFEDICCIMPTAPLLTSDDLIDGFNLYQKHNRKKPLLVVAPFPVPVEWAFYRDENTLLTPRDTNSLTIRSQDIKPAFYEAGPFSIFRFAHLQNENLFKDLKFLSLLVTKSRAVDIDDPEDLELAKTLYLGRLALNSI